MEEGGTVDLKRLWEDQRAFNRQIFDPADPSANLIERLKDLGLGAIEEVMEFLRTYEFKPHRRNKMRLQNVAHSHEELIDLFKFWLSLADASGFPIEKLEEMYWAKSQVVRYRYQEEWAAQVDSPCVIVDIDGVLADYCCGICNWLRKNGPDILGMGTVVFAREEFLNRVDRLQTEHAYVNAEALQVTHEEWRKLKHHFRIQGEKKIMPVYPDAPRFLRWCRTQGYKIILVTSRPINEYPNLFTDTMTWLTANRLPFDYLWWATEKAERIQEGNVLAHTVFAVDDDPRYANQFTAKGVRTYLLQRWGTNSNRPEMNPISLRDIERIEDAKKYVETSGFEWAEDLDE